jgi:hypothetical protein
MEHVGVTEWEVSKSAPKDFGVLKVPSAYVHIVDKAAVSHL